MGALDDSTDNVKRYGCTPPYHKVEVIRGVITYLPDKETYPVYWEQKDKEEIEKCKSRCSCKKGVSLVIDTMRERSILFNIEEFSILEGIPSEECITQIEEELFEIDRSELLVLTPYHNITPFVYNQLSKLYSSKNQDNYLADNRFFLQEKRSEKGKPALFFKVYAESGFRIILPWQDYVAFLKEKEFDIPQYTIPGY